MPDAISARRFPAVVLVAALLAASPPASALRLAERLGAPAAAAAERVADEALAAIGTPYAFGASDDAVDCSSLMQKVYRAAGVELPRTTREQIDTGTAIAAGELRKGDLVFYRWRRAGLHVGVVVDDGLIVHASPKRGRVVLTRLSSSWKRRLVAARRLLGPAPRGT